MPSPPRTREFYRPLLEDIHEAARDWRNGLSRLRPSEVLIIAVMLLAGPVLVFSLVQYTASLKSDVAFVPREFSPQSGPPNRSPAVTVETGPVLEFTQRGAVFGPGRATVTLAGGHFTDDDMPELSSIVTLESVTMIDANVTDDGLRDLRLPRLEELVLINTRVTESAAEAYPETNGTPNVRVRLVREFGE